MALFDAAGNLEACRPYRRVVGLGKQPGQVGDRGVELTPQATLTTDDVANLGPRFRPGWANFGRPITRFWSTRALQRRNQLDCMNVGVRPTPS